MNKQEFKQRWESNEEGGGITYDDIAECAKAWGLVSNPRACSMDTVTKLVLKAAEVAE
jgi:hypothetical protein